MRKLLLIAVLLCLCSSACKSGSDPARIDPHQLKIPTDYVAPTNPPPIR